MTWQNGISQDALEIAAIAAKKRLRLAQNIQLLVEINTDIFGPDKAMERACVELRISEKDGVYHLSQIERYQNAVLDIAAKIKAGAA